MEKLWYYTFNDQLRINPEDHSIFIAESALAPKEQREKTAEIMFESFKTLGIGIATNAILSMHSLQRKTGVVVDSGDTMTQIVPVHDGKAVISSSICLDLGGRDLTEYLMSMFTTERKYHFGSLSDREIVRKIKEKFCYVSLDLNKESTNEKYYEFSSGQDLTVGNEQFRCPEALFKPASLLKKDIPALHEAIYNVIKKFDNALQKELYANIVLAGGNTMYDGIAERIYKEVCDLAPKDVNVKIVASYDRLYSSWMGGSNWVLSGEFKSNLISKQEYEETGPSILQRVKKS